MKMALKIIKTDASSAADLLTQLVDLIADRTVAMMEERFEIGTKTEEGPLAEAVQETIQPKRCKEMFGNNGAGGGV